MKIENSHQFGNEIRNRRKTLGYTQADLADVSGVGVMFVSQLERGKPTSQLEKAIHVANVVGLDVMLVNRGGA